MPPNNQTVINGKVFDHSSVTFQLEGEAYVGIKSVNYDDNAGGKLLYGTGRAPIGATGTQYKPTFKFTMYRKWWDYLMASPALEGKPLSEVVLSAVISYGKGADLTTDEIPAFTIMHRTTSSTEGEDAIVVEAECLVLQPILMNGVALVSPNA